MVVMGSVQYGNTRAFRATPQDGGQSINQMRMQHVRAAFRREWSESGGLHPDSKHHADATRLFYSQAVGCREQTTNKHFLGSG